MSDSVVSTAPAAPTARTAPAALISGCSDGAGFFCEADGAGCSDGSDGPGPVDGLIRDRGLSALSASPCWQHVLVVIDDAAWIVTGGAAVDAVVVALVAGADQASTPPPRSCPADWDAERRGGARRPDRFLQPVRGVDVEVTGRSSCRPGRLVRRDHARPRRAGDHPRPAGTTWKWPTSTTRSSASAAVSPGGVQHRDLRHAARLRVDQRAIRN